MKQRTRSYLLISTLAAAGWLCNGEMAPSSSGFLLASAEARFGRPATPGVGRGSVGGPASGVGVRPGAGAGRAGVGVNRGGPVNRVGVR